MVSILSCFEIDLDFSSQNFSQQIVIGFAENATSEFDVGIDWVAPPLSPDANSFDVRIIHADYDLIKDIRSIHDYEYEYLINWSAGNYETTLNLPQAIPENFELLLTDFDETFEISLNENQLISLSDYPELTDQFKILLINENNLKTEFDYPIEDFTMHAYPNPFNAEVTIDLNLSMVEQLRVTALHILDINGKLIENISPKKLITQNQSYQWNAEAHPSGIYFLIPQTGSQSLTNFKPKKLILLK